MKLNDLVVCFLGLHCFVAFARPAKRFSTASAIEALLTQLTTEANTAASDLQAFESGGSGGTLAEALAIHNSLVKLDSDLNNGTSSLPAASPLSEADGTVIVNQANTGLTPALDSLFDDISTFSGSGISLGGVAALVEQDGQKLEADSTAFYTALQAVLPADVATHLIFPAPPIDTPT